ncbi:MAG: leucine--tRNA ligase [Deltaproteobacteria bacterium]|nr:leucine--tRNA ligase [Deltaproteobacteria bacterium]
MKEKYHAKEIESKWQNYWRKHDVFHMDADDSGKNFYTLEMFPYPSGDLHMGHIRVYSIGDALARYHLARGFRVFHPMGWDALGLPAENAAIRDGVHPAVRTRKNIERVKEQMQKMGWGYDWSREISTCDPEYYKWNQWFFLKMLERDLVYRKTDSVVNWCPSCETVIANEQAEGGVCERCGSDVAIRNMPEWAFRITRYADELLDGLDVLEDWPDRIKTMQRNWIGRSTGAQVEFQVEDGSEPIEVFTTRLDTIYGCTYLVLAPEHVRVRQLTSRDKLSELERFLNKIAKQDRAYRSAEDAPKEGMFLGTYAINPFNNERVPIWVANFVLADYGTGAVMSVPAHDTRDFAFAKKYGLPVRISIEPEHSAFDHKVLDKAYTKDGYLTNSGPYSALSSEDARVKMAEYAEKNAFGKATVSFHLRDWGFSRQRYWGTPIPVIYCDKCGMVPVPYEDLPVVLPENVEFTGKGGSPLARVDEFVNTKCPRCNGPAARETDTMDTFVDSSWYFARYLDPHNNELPFSRNAADIWLPVDLYVGGPEHAVMHLLYFRFWTKVMRDLDLLNVDEPVKRFLTQGMVCNWSSKCPDHGYIKRQDVKQGDDGTQICPSCGKPLDRKLEKMSKTKLNGVSPDPFLEKFGADAMRLFILFAAPPEKDLEWSDQGPEGTFRFLRRIHDLFSRHESLLKKGSDIDLKASGLDRDARELWKKANRTIEKVTNDVERTCQFNTAVAALMEMLNEAYKFEVRRDDEQHVALICFLADIFARLLGPFAPHLAEELWQALGHEDSVLYAGWPKADREALVQEHVTVAIQVNGKVRARLSIEASLGDDDISKLALADENVIKHLGGEEPKKVIVIRTRGEGRPPRLVSVVV